jgi:pyruvate dehydrogenase E2 component (dihydrolipoamide acetyltransferase)
VARLMRMPEVAAGGTSAVLHEWGVAEQAEFGAQDVLATVETDKAVVDVEAEQAGVVLKLLVGPGTTVEVGAPIAVLGDPGEAVADVDGVLLALGVSAAASVAPDPEGAPDQPASPTVPASLVGATVRATVVPPAGNHDGHGRVFASPLARRLARDAGLSLAGITGTGPSGRIVRRDVEAARQVPAVPTPRHAEPEPAPFTDVPHTPMRRAIARRLTESKQAVPHFTVRATLRVDELLRLRAGLADVGMKVSVTDLLVKAAARAHVAVPRMNAIWTPEATRIFSTVDVAVAVATETGLLTPVVRGGEVLPVGVIAGTVRDLVARARAGTLRQEELEGGALTITNLGMYGTEEFAAIINPPQSAILAVGAARQEPVVVDGALAVATVVHVTLSADHRVIDGALAARWMAALAESVEQPLRLLV